MKQDGFRLESMDEFARYATSLGNADPNRRYSSISWFTDGSYTKKDDKCGWAASGVVCDEFLSGEANAEGYGLLGYVRSPITDAGSFGASKLSAALAETAAITAALLQVIKLLPDDAYLHFDALSIGRAIEGVYKAQDDLKEAITAAAGLRCIAEQVTRLHFIHVKAHDSSPWNECADAHAGEASEDLDGAVRKLLPVNWYVYDAPLPNWAWIYQSSSRYLSGLGLPYFDGAKFSCTTFTGTPPSGECLSVTEQQPLEPDEFARVDLKMCSFNVNAGLDVEASGNKARGKDEIVRDQLHELDVHAVGIQEGNAGQAQTLVTRNYTRLLAGPKGKSKRGDVEFWFNTEIGWGTQGKGCLGCPTRISLCCWLGSGTCLWR